MTTLYRNISLVQIPIKQGVVEYRWPKNVDWAGERIDKILLATPIANTVLSPVDGQTHVLTEAQLRGALYFDLYNNRDQELALGLYYQQLLASNNYPVEINETLSLRQSRLFFTQAPTVDGCLLLYVFWGSKHDENHEPARNSVTVHFPLGANEKLSLREIINTYVSADFKKIRGIECWGSETNPAYLTLRDKQLTYIVKSVLTSLARPQMAGATASTSQVQPMLFDSLDIDFDYSFIRNATATANNQTITIYY